MERVDFYFDPICPWCWITSRWLREVAPQRDLDLHWRPFSLLVKNYRMEGGHGNPDYRHRYEATHGLLRLMEAVRHQHGDDIVDRLYRDAGRRIHHDRERWPEAGDLLEAAGLDGRLADAVDDERWDPTIEASMQRAVEIAGDDVGVPLVVFGDRCGYFGPVLSPRPTGDDALAVFDAVRLLADHPGFWELKRDRGGVRPEVGDRP